MKRCKHVEGNLYEFSSAPIQARNRQLAQKLFTEGCEAEETFQIDLALDLYHRALEYDSHHADSWMSIGFLEWQNGDPIAAEDCYRKAIDAASRYPLANFNLAVCLSNRGEVGEAIIHYLRAIDLEPQYADAHLNLAHLYSFRAEHQKAIAHYRLYLRYGDDDPLSRTEAEDKIRKGIEKLAADRNLQSVPRSVA